MSEIDWLESLFEEWCEEEYDMYSDASRDTCADISYFIGWIKERKVKT